jgi:ribosomal protein L31
MLHEQEFICWHTNQDEGDGKEIKATSIRSAAKKAVDIWKAEHPTGIGREKITVYVKDEARRVHQIVIYGEDDERTPEAFA